MPTSVSVPATFIISISDEVMVTFAIPANFVCASGSLNIVGTGVGPYYQAQVFWTLPPGPDIDPIGYSGSAYNATITVGAGGIASITAVAGTNMPATINCYSDSGDQLLNVSSCVLTMVGTFSGTGPRAYADIID